MEMINNMGAKYNVAVVGATGAVGEELFRVMEEMNFPVGELLPLASANSAGNKIEFNGKEYTVVELTDTVFSEHEVDIAFFSAGGSISEKFAKYAVESGAVVIDNTSHFRMEPNIPLVVPEVNPEDVELWRETGIIANPNCSTIQMVQALKPLDDLYGIKRVDVSKILPINTGKSDFSRASIVISPKPLQLNTNSTKNAPAKSDANQPDIEVNTGLIALGSKWFLMIFLALSPFDFAKVI